MPFYEFRSYVGTSGIIRESDQNPTTLVQRLLFATTAVWVCLPPKLPNFGKYSSNQKVNPRNFGQNRERKPKIHTQKTTLIAQGKNQSSFCEKQTYIWGWWCYWISAYITISTLKFVSILLRTQSLSICATKEQCSDLWIRRKLTYKTQTLLLL